MRMTGNTLLITGGGTGIGRELARRFSDLGNTVIVTGRRLSSLQETVAGRPGMHAFVLDVDDPVAMEAGVQTLVRQFPALNVLINNAGIMRYEDLTTRGDLHDAQAQIATNLLAPVRLTNALVDHLKQQSDPVVVTVSSGLAFVPRADAAIYSATKAAIHVYTMCLREQLAGQVSVVELIPPAVQTELTPGQSSREGYQPLAAFMDEVMALLGEQPTPDEVVVARARVQRLAEREGRFEAVFDRINAMAAAQHRPA